MSRNSIAFQNMREALFEAMRDIPVGRVTEFSMMGAALNIPARHVAFIVSKMTGDEREVLPWYRLVPKDGKFGSAEKWSSDRARQVELLRKEGVFVEKSGTLTLFQEQIHVPNDRHSKTVWADVPDD